MNPPDKAYRKEYTRLYFEKNGAKLPETKFSVPEDKRVVGDDTLSFVEIVSDPDPLGAFPKGSRLNNLGPMLKLNAFTPNTILLKNGVKYRVSQIMGTQRLVPVE